MLTGTDTRHCFEDRSGRKIRGCDSEWLSRALYRLIEKDVAQRGAFNASRFSHVNNTIHRSRIMLNKFKRFQRFYPLLSLTLHERVLMLNCAVFAELPRHPSLPSQAGFCPTPLRLIHHVNPFLNWKEAITSDLKRHEQNPISSFPFSQEMNQNLNSICHRYVFAAASRAEIRSRIRRKEKTSHHHHRHRHHHRQIKMLSSGHSQRAMDVEDEVEDSWIAYSTCAFPSNFVD